MKEKSSGKFEFYLKTEKSIKTSAEIQYYVQQFILDLQNIRQKEHYIKTNL